MGDADVSVDEACVRLRTHAFAEDRALRAVARDLVARRLASRRRHAGGAALGA